MSLLKLPFLFVNGLSVQLTLTSPNPTPPSSETSKVKDKWGTSWITWGPTMTKTLYWVAVLGEAAAIVAHANPTHPYAQEVLPFLARHPVGLHHVEITTPFLVGSALITFSSLLRYVCYRTLGRFFTFELALRDKHKLVTSGPYGWVRHPSYTGAVFCLAGFWLTAVGPGSWLRASGWFTGTAGVAALGGFTAFLTWISSVLIWRTSAEDKLLQKEFGQEWDEWASRVRWRILPGVY
ncbi:hypothetical protein DENSPDRAFT_842399 [Dentipellis sp. KUC8613]|nr:hypothetical protein DENSPDRAFT_842399 [Dentipellis sp. KUC8613]